MPGNRVPPAHAPAWGRRRHDGDDGPERNRGPHHGGGDHQRVRGPDNDDQQRTRTGSQRGVRLNDPTITTTPLTAEPDREAERARERRLSEEEYRQFTEDRSRREELARKTVHKPIDDDARSRSELHLSRERRIDVESAGRIPIRRALAAMERAADYLANGMGREASLTLASEAAQAKGDAFAIGPKHPDGRVLDAISANMNTRADGIRATVPAEARRAADRLDRIAAGTDGRARALEAVGRKSDAELLRTLAQDSRAQALFFRSAAQNTDATVGRGLVGAIAELGGPGTDLLHSNRPGSRTGHGDATEDRKALHTAVAELDRSLNDDPRAFHELLEQAAAPRRNSRSELMRRFKALEALQDNDATKYLLAPFAELAKSLSDGDPRAANLARTHILRELKKQQQLELLRQIVESRGASAHGGKLPPRDRFPLALLKAVLTGGIGPLAKDCSAAVLAKWIDPGVRAIPIDGKLLPHEAVLSDIFHGKLPALRGETWPNPMLLGSDELFRSTGTVTQQIRANVSSAVAFDRGAGPLAALPPFAPHETAVFADSRGAILVRGPAGPEWHDGHLFAADGSRVYFDVDALPEGITTVHYESAADSDQEFTRLEVMLGGGEDAIISLDDLLIPQFARNRVVENEPERDDPRKRVTERILGAPEKRRVYRGQDFDDVTAVAIFEPGVEPSGFQGLTTRHAARLAADELERMKTIRFVLLESAADAGDRLILEGVADAEAESFRAYVEEILAEHELAMKTTGALILLAPAARRGRARALKRGVSRGSKGRSATFLPQGGPSEALVLLDEHWRDPKLLESGILIYRGGIIVD